MARNKYPEETIKLILDVSTKFFLEKGYDRTSVQDIIEATGLSKGAIYHHFPSKEAIFDEICNIISKDDQLILIRIRDNKAMKGAEKLKGIFRASLLGVNQNMVLSLTPNLLDNPRLLSTFVKRIYNVIAPEFIYPVLKEGMKDGSLNVEHPYEMAEAVIVLYNIWLNPLMYPISIEGMKNRCQVFNGLFQSMGIELLDEEMIEGYINYCLMLQKR